MRRYTALLKSGYTIRNRKDGTGWYRLLKTQNRTIENLNRTRLHSMLPDGKELFHTCKANARFFRNFLI